jgi:hypothetical protein
LAQWHLNPKVVARESGANLDEVVEDAEALWVLAGLDVDEGSDLGGGEGDVLVAHDDLKLLPADAVGFRPVIVVFLHDLRAGSIKH